MTKRSKADIVKLPALAGLALLVFWAGAAAPAPGDPPAAGRPDTYTISVNVGLVVLPVVVTDGRGQAVSGLGQNDFHVFDDGRPQQISLFEADDVPVTAGLVVDNSGSMWPKRPEVLAAAEVFARSSNPHDQMFVVNFNQNVFMGLPDSVPFTNSTQELLRALGRGPMAGNTALYDGVAAALQHIKAGTADRKALIVISDGGDNASRIGLPELLKRAQAANVEIYALGIYNDYYKGEDLDVLRQLAKVTGGKSYFPRVASQVPEICRQIAQELREQYTIGYHPSDVRSSGSYHVIRVTARAAGSGKLHVSTRAGYVMPSDFQAGPMTDKAAL